jgi:TatD DNase family protein
MILVLIDSHCHIHSKDYPDSVDAYLRAQKAEVKNIICVGIDIVDSELAVKFSSEHNGVFAAIGIHPHEATKDLGNIDQLKTLFNSKTTKNIVAIGEIGLDYFYEHSDRKIQQQLLEQQLQLAKDLKLPVIFHVRDAFDDFWPIFDNFSNIRGVLHSFTDIMKNAEQAFSRDLLIGINGISTFTKDEKQQQLFRDVPLSKILLETDAPYLTPSPYRGKLNEPAYVKMVAEHLAKEKNISFNEVASQTSHNATNLFYL